MKRFLISWVETDTYSCSKEFEAESVEDALRQWHDDALETNTSRDLSDQEVDTPEESDVEELEDCE